MEILILSILLISSLLWAFSSMGLVGSNNKIELPSIGFVIIGKWNDALDKRLRMFVANQYRVCHKTHWKNMDSIRKHGLLVKESPSAGGMDAGVGISPEQARLKYATGIHACVGSWFPSDHEIGHLPIGIVNKYAHNLAESSRINQHIILERDIPPEDLLIPHSKELFSDGYYTILKSRFEKLFKSKEILSKPRTKGNWKKYTQAEEDYKRYKHDGFSSLTGPMTSRISDYRNIFDRMEGMFGKNWQNNTNFRTKEIEDDFIKLKDNPDFIKMMEYYELIRSVRDMELSQFLQIFLGDLITIRTIPRTRKKSKRKTTEIEELGDSVDWD